ncbi:MAG: AAA family ATPase [Patescibacteria group bacterium]
MTPFRSQLEASPLYPLFILDSFLSHRWRHQLLRVMSWALTLLFFTLILIGLAPLWPAAASWLGQLQSFATVAVGLFAIFLAVWLDTYLAEAFFRYRYFSGATGAVSFEVGRLLYRTTESDLVCGFLLSGVGARWLARLGLERAARDSFLAARRALTPPTATTLTLSPAKLLSLAELVERLLDENPDLDKWLLGFEIKRLEAVGAARWIEREREIWRTHERWWTRERLGRIPGLAKDWAYGESYLLNQYSIDLLTAAETTPVLAEFLWRSAPAKQVETILVRAREANALLVGPAGAPLETVYELSKLIRTGRSLPALEPKHPKLFRTSVLFSRFKERQGFEQELIKIFNEVIKVGNVILVIDDLPSFILGAAALGANLEQLLDPYLASAKVQVIALAETAAYHRTIEANPFLRQRFEIVTLTEPETAAVLDRLLGAAEVIERQQAGKLIFTYPALVTLVDLAEQFFNQESEIDQAFDLLLELTPWALDAGRRMVDKSAVLTFATEKLKVPLGQIAPTEREQLLTLEKHLHERVIGQDQAIVAIARALRRSRVGVRNLKRPLGSFLFLGPTGVGKTETAKALAAVFFGGEDRLLRLDMSEYRGPETLKKLIGSVETGEPGILSKLLRDQPYGVLLLDEFEKTEPEVLNLFLQILDEGVFSDMRGQRVNARNLMLIATSNAGAPLIWDLVASGRHLLEAEKTIMESLIKQNIFKPELLNRFDGVIIFNPLGEGERRAVARLLLNRLALRLKERGLIFKITDLAVEAVVHGGTNQQFGARPLARYIQDAIEQLVADKLLSGEIKSGQEIELQVDPTDSQKLTLQVN